MGLRFGELMILTGWLVYGNVLYYGQMTECDSGLRFGMFVLVLFGYLSMAECCLTGCFLIFLVPIYFFMLRRQRRANWIPAPPNFIKQLYKTRFNPEANKAQDMCPICMADFQPSEPIVALPCDEKHYFHANCIKAWLEKNNTCPLCKKEITKEALKEQKKLLKTKAAKKPA